MDVNEEEQIDTAIAISLTEGDIRSISMNPKANEQLHPDEIQAISAPDYCLKSSHINAAMYILQRQFPELGGFYKVQHGTDLTERERGKMDSNYSFWAISLGHRSIRVLQQAFRSYLR